MLTLIILILNVLSNRAMGQLYLLPHRKLLFFCTAGASHLVSICVFFLQPVPNWLEAEARRNPEGHHGTGGGQRFGGRDIRTSGPGFNHNSAGPGFVAPGQPLERDDGWD